jgi:hypothetical protein
MPLPQPVFCSWQAWWPYWADARKPYNVFHITGHSDASARPISVAVLGSLILVIGWNRLLAGRRHVWTMRL